MNNDYYEILGVSKNANQDEIKKAFRKKAAQLHPDRNKATDAAEQFKKVNEAYQVLSDEKKRQVYDNYGAEAVNGAAGGSPFGGAQVEFDINDIFGGGFDSIFGDANPFGDIFGRRTSTADRNKGSDVFVRMKITYEDVLNGPEKELTYNRKEMCKACKGVGGEKVEECKTCKGTGKVNQVTRSIFGNVQMVRECPECKGTGKTILQKCKVCNGSSTVDASRTFKIRVPKGVEDGMNVKFSGEGNAGKFNGPGGDLYVELSIESDKRFKREGDNLIYTIDLPIYSLVLGDQVKISTLDGDKKVHVPAGLQVGEKLILKELGLPNLRSKKRGNIILDITVDIPKNLNSQEKELYTKLKETGEEKGKGFWK